MLVMCVDDLFYNCQSQTGSLAVFSTGGVNLIETVPDLWKAVFGDSGSVIFYRYEGLVIFHRGLNLDRRIIFAEFDSIVQ